METEQFKKTIAKGVTLADFNASWCAPCRTQEPVIKKLTAIYQDRVAILEIDIDSHNALATEYRVQSIPTLILFKDSKEVRRFVGLQPEETIVKSLERLF